MAEEKKIVRTYAEAFTEVDACAGLLMKLFKGPLGLVVMILMLKFLDYLAGGESMTVTLQEMVDKKTAAEAPTSDTPETAKPTEVKADAPEPGQGRC